MVEVCCKMLLNRVFSKVTYDDVNAQMCYASYGQQCTVYLTIRIKLGPVYRAVNLLMLYCVGCWKIIT